MYFAPEDLIKLLLSLALGGLIGAERELRDKAAGLRTLMFIAAGSTLFTIFSYRLAGVSGADPTRIAAQIVTGVGFLGAGAIMRDRGEIRGLTTAATIWLVAALGVGIGGGQLAFSALATGIFLLALFIFPYLERGMGGFRQVHTYTITTQASQAKYLALLDLTRQHHLRLMLTRRTRSEAEMTVTLTLSGSQAGHESFIEALFADPEIKAFEE